VTPDQLLADGAPSALKSSRLPLVLEAVVLLQGQI